MFNIITFILYFCLWPIDSLSISILTWKDLPTIIYLSIYSSNNLNDLKSDRANDEVINMSYLVSIISQQIELTTS